MIRQYIVLISYLFLTLAAVVYNLGRMDPTSLVSILWACATAIVWVLVLSALALLLSGGYPIKVSNDR